MIGLHAQHSVVILDRALLITQRLPGEPPAPEHLEIVRREIGGHCIRLQGRPVLLAVEVGRRSPARRQRIGDARVRYSGKQIGRDNELAARVGRERVGQEPHLGVGGSPLNHGQVGLGYTLVGLLLRRQRQGRPDPAALATRGHRLQHHDRAREPGRNVVRVHPHRAIRPRARLGQVADQRVDPRALHERLDARRVGLDCPRERRKCQREKLLRIRSRGTVPAAQAIEPYGDLPPQIQMRLCRRLALQRLGFEPLRLLRTLRRRCGSAPLGNHQRAHSDRYADRHHCGRRDQRLVPLQPPACPLKTGRRSGGDRFPPRPPLEVGRQTAGAGIATRANLLQTLQRDRVERRRNARVARAGRLGILAKHAIEQLV